MGYKTLFEQIKTACAWNSLKPVFYWSCVNRLVWTVEGMITLERISQKQNGVVGQRQRQNI